MTPLAWSLIDQYYDYSPPSDLQDTLVVWQDDVSITIRWRAGGVRTTAKWILRDGTWLMIQP